jgi:hypothetical protein
MIWDDILSRHRSPTLTNPWIPRFSTPVWRCWVSAKETGTYEACCVLVVSLVVVSLGVTCGGVTCGGVTCGGVTCGVTSSTDNTLKRQAWVTLTVACIRTCISICCQYKDEDDQDSRFLHFHFFTFYIFSLFHFLLFAFLHVAAFPIAGTNSTNDVGPSIPP